MGINITDLAEAAKTTAPLEDVATDGYTAYAIAGVINAVFESLGVNDVVKQQTMYNYSRAGRIDGRKYEAGQKPRFSEETVKAFVAKFVARRLKGKFVESADVEQGWSDEDDVTEQDNTDSE